MSNDQQESESDRSSTAVEPRSQEMATTNTTSNSCVPQTNSTTPVKAANGQHSHGRSYGVLAKNGAHCSCDESCDDSAVSESQPLLASRSTVSELELVCSIKVLGRVNVSCIISVACAIINPKCKWSEISLAPQVHFQHFNVAYCMRSSHFPAWHCSSEKLGTRLL